MSEMHSCKSEQGPNFAVLRTTCTAHLYCQHLKIAWNALSMACESDALRAVCDACVQVRAIVSGQGRARPVSRHHPDALVDINLLRHDICTAVDPTSALCPPPLPP